MTDRAVVLAGGDSERFGDPDKALAAFEGEPLVGRVVERAREATDAAPVVAVADEERAGTYDDVLSDVRFVQDVPERAGPVAGLAAAVAAVEADWLFVCGCDMPRLDPDAVRWLRGGAAAEVEAVVPVVDGRDQPLHGWFRREPLAAALDAAGDSLHSVLDELAVRAVPADDAPAGVPLAASVTNVNSRADLDRVRSEVEE